MANHDLLEILQNLPSIYLWYVEDYVEKNCTHEIYQEILDMPEIIPCTMSSTCPSCKHYAALGYNSNETHHAIAKSDISHNKKKPLAKHGVQTNSTFSSVRKSNVKIGQGMDCMVDDFVQWIYKEYGYVDEMAWYSVKDRVCRSLNYYYKISDEDGRDGALKSIVGLVTSNTLHLCSGPSHSRDNIPSNREPRFTDMIYLNNEHKMREAMYVFISLANRGGCISEVANAILADQDVTILSLFLSELFHCMSCSDSSEYLAALTGPHLIFRQLEKHGYRNTLEWVIQEVDSFSMMMEKLSNKFFLFGNLRQCKKQEIKSIIQIILKYHSKYNEVKFETDQMMSVNPLFMPIFAILQFKKFIRRGK